MNMPMEILSQVTTLTDSGMGATNASRSTSNRTNARFDKIFEKELDKNDRRMQGRRANTNSNIGAPKSEQRTEPREANRRRFNSQQSQSKSSENSNKVGENGEAITTGVMGTQDNEVVFILEGDKESVATPEVRAVNNTEPADINRIQNPNTESAAKNTEATTENTKANAFRLDAEYVNEAVTDKIGTKLHVITAEEESTKAATVNENATTVGEQAARMPEIRPKDGQEGNNNNNEKFSNNGNLSPLENDNDKAITTGQEKSYSDAANAVKNKAEEETSSKPESIPTDIPPPLSEGIKPEQFKATQQMTQAAVNSPVKPENLFQEMISRVETMQTNTKNTMTIQLNPEFLGKVALEVAIDTAGLHVKINAEDSSVRSMINGQITALIESLENKGIAVAGVEVVYTAVDYNGLNGQSETQQQRSGSQRHGHRDIDTKKSIEYYTALPDIMDYYLDSGISSVEYRA